jgi:SAM-dependent methyltransferase
MDDYLWGVYVTNFLWAHHLELSLFFRDRFVNRLPRAPEIVEIAPGHGGWGVWALSLRPDATLRGFDIAPSSVAIAGSIARAAGVAGRASYSERDALDLASLPGESADAVICSFLLEHLEEPERLASVVCHLLRPQRRAYLAGALTAAQVDHIFEFRRESELVALCEDNGLRVLETISVSPPRTLKGAHFLPRSMGLIVERRKGEIW